MYRKRNNKKWQKAYIKEVFEHKNKKTKNYSSIILNNIYLLKDKDQYLPDTLYKFYRSTSDNILDIKNQRIWMSDPDSFNDPFDCKIGYNSLTYEKQCLLDFINSTGCVNEGSKSNGFTNGELERIIRTSTTLENYSFYNKVEDYKDVVRKVLQPKSKDFQQKISKFLIETVKESKYKISKFREAGIRVACFSTFDRYDEFYKKIQMWSHYADNHKGFCVEYDISPLKSEVTLALEDSDYYSIEDKYMEERIRAVIKGGLFPVIYTSNRVNIPMTKLKKLNVSDIEKLDFQHDIDEIIYKAFIVKSTNWSYEKEWRIILDRNICSYYDNKITFPYIKRIYLGCKMDNKTVDAMLEIGEELGVEVVMMGMDGSKFLLDSSDAKFYKWDKARLKWRNPYDI